MKKHKFEIGQKVLWRGSWGSKIEKMATITELDMGERKWIGEPLYILDNGHWAYEFQLSEI